MRRAFRRRFLAMIAVLLAAALAAGQPAGAVGDRFPGTTWETRTPEELGLDASKLDELQSLVGGSGCVIYDGFMIKSWGTIDVRWDWASAAKPVIATMLLFAAAEQQISGVDEPIALQSDWALIPQDQPMTYRNLVNMTSGYARAESPGDAWAYNDYGVLLHARTLFDDIYVAWPDDAATDPQRLGALGFQDGGLFGSREGYGVLASVRDYARVGWFWLNHGRWHDDQVLPAGLFGQHLRPEVAETTPHSDAEHPQGDYLGVGSFGGQSDQTPYGPGIYGFGWWFNGHGPLHPGALTWPDAPRTAFQANGHWGGEVVTAIPGLDLLLVHRDGPGVGFEPGSATSAANQSLRLLVEAVRPRPLLAVGKSGADLVLQWTDDCSGTDYAVYEGTLGQWYDHTPLACSDLGGDTVEIVPDGGGDRYYLVAPRDGGTEGSYGRDAGQVERPVSLSACGTSQNLAICP